MPDPDKPKKKQQRRARGEGAVFYSDSKGCWLWKAIVGTKPGGGVRYKQGRAKTQQLALQRKQAAERGHQQPHEDKLTVEEFLAHWLETSKPNTRGNTWTRYEEVVRVHLKPRIGGGPLKKLTVAAVTRLWTDMHRDEVSAGTIRKVSEVLATALEQAVAEGHITKAPTANATKPKVQQEEIHPFTDEESKKILAEATGHRLELLWYLAFGTGARQGELLAIERDDFDLKAGTVRITKMLDHRKGVFTVQAPKSKSGTRTIDLPEFALAAVRRHIEGRGPGPVFTTASGKYIARNNIGNQDWRPLLARAGVDYRKFHTARHTHASRLLAAGVDVLEVAKRLGDKVETILRTYAHWIPTKNRDTVSKLDAIYGDTTPRGEAEAA